MLGVIGKIGAIIAGSAALIGGVFDHPNVMQSFPPQAAMVQRIIAEPLTVPKIPVPETNSATLALLPNLLPAVAIRMVHPVSHATTSTRGSAPTTAPTIHPQTPPSGPITTQAFLDATTITTTERRDGPFEVTLSTSLPGGTTPTIWDFSQTTVGSNPAFSMSYSCNPNPLFPDPASSDQNPTFTPRTPYKCTISLTPLSGSDLRTQSKEFDFTIPPGQLIVTTPPSMNTVLKSGENTGGFVFTNNDAVAATVSQLTLDVSYTALTPAYGPTVLRVVNPATGQSAGDYHLESLPADPSRPYSYSQSGITIPISFKVMPGSQKMIPIEVLGVHTMSIQDVNPTLTISLRNVQNDHDSQTVVNGATLTWSCIVSFAIYDPNATSGAIASGQACGIGGN